MKPSTFHTPQRLHMPNGKSHFENGCTTEKGNEFVLNNVVVMLSTYLLVQQSFEKGLLIKLFIISNSYNF